MNLRQAAQQALEALESDPDAMVEVTECHWDYKRDLAINALRAALAEPEQPVAWMDIDDKGQRHGLRYYSDGSSDEVPLYTAPTPRKPLTKEQALAAFSMDSNESFADFLAGIRCAERAHGIGEQT